MAFNTEADFWRKIDVRGENECWEWQAGKDAWGYGQHVVRCKRFASHRLAWTYTHGDIPEGLCVLHTCDNPGCCNVASHLFLGTNDDNIRDKCAKGRQARQKGEQHGRAKLTEEQVRQIRALVDEGYTQTQVAKRFGITQPHVSYICSGRFWSHAA